MMHFVEALSGLGGFTGLGALLAATGALVHSRRAQRTTDRIFEKTERIEEQAVNEHGPDGKNLNLRAQIDGVQGDMESVKASVQRIGDSVAQSAAQTVALGEKIDRGYWQLQKQLDAEAEERRQHVAYAHRTQERFEQDLRAIESRLSGGDPGVA